MSASLTPVSNTTFNPGKRNILPFLPGDLAEFRSAYAHEPHNLRVARPC